MKKIIEDQIKYYESVITKIRKDISNVVSIDTDVEALAGSMMISTLELVCTDLKRCVAKAV